MDLFEDARTFCRSGHDFGDTTGQEPLNSTIARQRRKDKMIAEASERDFEKNLPWILTGQDFPKEE